MTHLWPFDGGPGKATAAQVAMFTAAYVDMLPKPQRKESDMAPHGKVDDLTMRQWKERHQKALADGTA